MTSARYEQEAARLLTQALPRVVPRDRSRYCDDGRNWVSVMSCGRAFCAVETIAEILALRDAADLIGGA